MIAGTGIGIHSETFPHHAFAALNGLAHQRTYAPLSIQLAFAVGHDDLRAPEFSTQCFAQQLERAAHVIRARTSDPLDPNTLYRVDDRVVSFSMRIGRARGRD